MSEGSELPATSLKNLRLTPSEYEYMAAIMGDTRFSDDEYAILGDITNKNGKFSIVQANRLLFSRHDPEKTT